MRILWEYDEKTIATTNHDDDDNHNYNYHNPPKMFNPPAH